MSRGTLDVEHSGQEEEPRRGGPPQKDRESEATEGVFCLRTKKPFHGTVRTGFFYFIVCLIAYSSRIFAPLTARAVRY